MSPKKNPKNQDYRAYLYRLLSSRPCTEREAVDRLVFRGADPREAANLAAEFRRLGLIDDKAYARLFVEGHRTWGKARICFELRRRGIDEEKMFKAVRETEETENEKARVLAEAWLLQGVEWRKIAGRLNRRGFSPDTVRAVQNRIARASEKGEDKS